MDDAPTPRPHRETEPQHSGDFSEALATEDAETDAVPRRRPARRGHVAAQPWPASPRDQ